MTEDKQNESTFEDNSPVFASWKGWYTLVIIVNIVIVGIIYLLFKAI